MLRSLPLLRAKYCILHCWNAVKTCGACADGLTQAGRGRPLLCRTPAGALTPWAGRALHPWGGLDKPLLGQHRQNSAKPTAAHRDCASAAASPWACALACPVPVVQHPRTPALCQLAAWPWGLGRWAAAFAALRTWWGAAARPQQGVNAGASRPPVSVLREMRLCCPCRTSVKALSLETPFIWHPSEAQRGAAHLHFPGGQSRTG